MKVAIIKMHDSTVWRAIALAEGQSADFDDDDEIATRRWLWPFLGTEFHLLDIVEVENLPNVTTNL